MHKRILTPLVAILLALSLGASALADTIRLKDGSVIRGQVIGFSNQQFTVLVGAGSRGRRSQITIYMEDVESIEFDSAGGAAASFPSGNDAGQTTRPPTGTTQQTTRPPVQQPVQTTRPPVQQQPIGDDDTGATQTGGGTQPASQSSVMFIPVFNSRVRADNAANGWTNSGLVARRGQRIRINASGRVTLGGGRVSTPAGLTGVTDNDKLMRSYPTGGLIAVIGDDNDDFIFIGTRREFIAQRDGVLFLGVNEGNLSDNTGAYDVVVEAEANR
ncbi:MAG TPA: hypothetical protein VJT74_14465 [Pyrinomonadaceae bacterium]|nr:hypothetical protein [Pyrinomonadaceae bacterium]